MKYTVKDVAFLLGTTPLNVREGMKNGELEKYGHAVKKDGNRNYTYYIEQVYVYEQMERIKHGH